MAKYVNVRRYFAYLERSIDLGTQLAVFEPNGEALGDGHPRNGLELPDRSSKTQNDLDNGRLVCLIGLRS